ncbi:MAG: HEAT repeat domain-containing protein [Deltaproteobacteria bacterium]|nr:HEAT repeat domain-containing protein [Kofleriaceae bacterium]
MRDLKADLESTDVETVYDALIRAGKTHRRELRPRVEAFLTTSDPGLREAALKVVAFYWRLPEHRDTARRALGEDADPDVRAAAAMALGGYADGADELQLLLDVALDAREEESVRDAAYSSALIIAGVSKVEYPMERTLPGFEERADWPLLARLVRAFGAAVPDRLDELAQRHTRSR